MHPLHGKAAIEVDASSNPYDLSLVNNVIIDEIQKRRENLPDGQPLFFIAPQAHSHIASWAQDITLIEQLQNAGLKVLYCREIPYNLWASELRDFYNTDIPDELYFTDNLSPDITRANLITDLGNRHLAAATSSYNLSKYLLQNIPNPNSKISSVFCDCARLEEDRMIPVLDIKDPGLQQNPKVRDLLKSLMSEEWSPEPNCIDPTVIKIRNLEMMRRIQQSIDMHHPDIVFITIGESHAYGNKASYALKDANMASHIDFEESFIDILQQAGHSYLARIFDAPYFDNASAKVNFRFDEAGPDLLQNTVLVGGLANIHIYGKELIIPGISTEAFQALRPLWQKEFEFLTRFLEESGSKYKPQMPDLNPDNGKKALKAEWRKIHRTAKQNTPG